MTAFIALAIAVLIPLAALYILRHFDFYQTGRFEYNLYTIGWGIIAYLLAVLINRALVNNGWMTVSQVKRFGAPVVEEILKALILLYLIRRADFKYFVDGAIYGFGAGIGFAIIENFEYVLGRPEIALSLATNRVLSTNLMHATGSAILGIALGISRSDSSYQRVLWLVAGAVLAMGQHIGFNNMVSAGALLGFAIAAGLGGAGFIWLSVRWGLTREKQDIKEKLGMQDRVTAGEAAIVQNFDKADVYLRPVAEKFGAQKATQCQQFLMKQAHLGLQRKNADLFKDNPKMLQAIEADIDRLSGEMEGLRKAVGAYCMLYLRGLIPPDASPVWGLLEKRLLELETDKTKAGTGLWTKLGERTKKATEESAG